MTLLLKKTSGLIKLIQSWYLGTRRDGPLLGYWNACRWHSVPLWNQLCFYVGAKQRIAPIAVQMYGKPLWLRPQTSDYEIFCQVFHEKEYADLGGVGDVKCILDCGANIGLASVYFLNRFPEATVLAVEPDPDNVGSCRRNLSGYGSRAQVLQGGVWGSRGRLTVVPSDFGLGQRCGMGVRQFHDGDSKEASVDAYDVPSLMAYARMDQVDLLKLDIERSELAVFSSSPDRWLPRVRNLIIELHDAECSQVYFSALKGYNYELSTRGDLTYCMNLQRLPVAQARSEAQAAQ